MTSEEREEKEKQVLLLQINLVRIETNIELFENQNAENARMMREDPESFRDSGCSISTQIRIEKLLTRLRNRKTQYEEQIEALLSGAQVPEFHNLALHGMTFGLDAIDSQKKTDIQKKIDIPPQKKIKRGPKATKTEKTKVVELIL